MSDAQRSRAKRTVVEGSGRLIPFGRSRVLEIDAQAMPSRPAAAAGFSSLFAGGHTPSHFILYRTTYRLPFRPRLQYTAPRPSPIPSHNSRQPPRLVLLPFVPFLPSSSHLFDHPRIFPRTQVLASGIVDGAHCPPFLAPHVVLCLSTEAGRRLGPCGCHIIY